MRADPDAGGAVERGPQERPRRRHRSVARAHRRADRGTDLLHPVRAARRRAVGPRLWERACISSHFRTMVVEGEEVQASATTTGDVSATIEAHKRDGTPALEGTISLGPDHPQVGLAARTKRYRRSPWRGRSGAAPSRSGSPAFFRSNRDRAPRFAGALLTSRVTVAYRRLLDVIGARSCAVPDDLSRMLVVSRGTASSAETCRSSSR